jgi:glycosyltransferase involved in cell wall biosynthesis
MQQAPKVSVAITTYNHEAYILQAVQSALAQQTSFPIEIVVGDDCSTDGTRRILQELKRAHPDKLWLLLHERNVGGPQNTAAVLAACRGQYIAMLEGDDYWTSPHKLQKQADALDAHGDWAICFHAGRVIHEDGSHKARIFPSNWTKSVASIDDLFQSNFMCTCSVMFRHGLFGELPAWHREVVPGDWAIHLLNADHGDIGYLDEVMGVYRVHRGGMWTRRNRATREADCLRMLSRIDHHFHGKYARQIDDYRIRLVTGLVWAKENVWHRKLRRRLTIPGRSLLYSLTRRVLRPFERAARLGKVALGLAAH